MHITLCLALLEHGGIFKLTERVNNFRLSSPPQQHARAASEQNQHLQRSEMQSLKHISISPRFRFNVSKAPFFLLAGCRACLP
jgi:hypothetical protein